jgi:cbb3-type cytochrome oxidase subunit 3
VVVLRDNAARAVVPALVVLGLVGVVAIASAGSTPTGTRQVRPPDDAVLDSFFTFMLVMLVVAAILVVYGLMQRKAIAEEMAKGRYRRLSFIGFTVFMLLFALLAYFRLRDWKSLEYVDELGEQGFPRGVPGSPEAQGGQETTYDAEFAWLPVLVLAAVIGLSVAVWYATTRRQEQRGEENAAAEAVALVLDDALDDLRAEKDARRAVIAAYARLERVLAAHGLGRKPAEAPGEYLSRILPRLELERGSVRRLTELFTRAKFSAHRVDAGMKEDAIDALATVRDELRAAEERRREKALAALETAVERP